MPNTNHYHVLSGLTGGYLPNTNDYCKTRRDAEASARWLAEGLRFDGIQISGSASAGWYDVRNGREYIEITKCSEADCSEDDF